MQQSRTEFEDFIKEDINETQLCQNCGNGNFTLIYVHYERTDGWAEALILCNRCKIEMKLKYMHPGLG